jgi:2,3-dihydroxy-p-cumate/2,3-dihydroxybenzoate 3,4-dioxygenase
MDTVAAALEQAGRPVHVGTKAECDSRRTRAFIASSDPSGNKIEILARPYNSGSKFFPGRQVGITNFSHVALFSTDTRRDTEFWTQLVNARVSDWLGEATFLRIGTVHHSVVLMPSSRPGIQHINHQVEDIDDVMQSYYWLKQRGVKIVYGPGRHPISTAMMVYFEGPDGMVYEYSVGVKHILPEQEATYRPRQFSLEAYNGDMWGSFTETEGLPREPAAAAKIRLVV